MPEINVTIENAAMYDADAAVEVVRTICDVCAFAERKLAQAKRVVGSYNVLLAPRRKGKTDYADTLTDTDGVPTIIVWPADPVTTTLGILQGVLRVATAATVKLNKDYRVALEQVGFGGKPTRPIPSDALLAEVKQYLDGIPWDLPEFVLKETAPAGKRSAYVCTHCGGTVPIGKRSLEAGMVLACHCTKAWVPLTAVDPPKQATPEQIARMQAEINRRAQEERESFESKIEAESELVAV